jgi:hypothetical protein
MAERRYNDAEVAAIFERAANSPRASQARLSSSAGMTLAELQAIGREVGIAPDEIRAAAQIVGHAGHETSRRFLGLPLGVGRTVELNRKLSDDEWERLVVDLRETFDARGNVRQDGSLRQWTNGNLQALLEPGVSGHRLRLRTMRGLSLNMMIMGLGVLGVATVSIAIGAAMGGPSMIKNIISGATIGIAGAVMFGFGALQLPAWARRRRQQMEEVAARIVNMAESRTDPPALR